MRKAKCLNKVTYKENGVEIRPGSRDLHDDTGLLPLFSPVDYSGKSRSLPSQAVESVADWHEAGPDCQEPGKGQQKDRGLEC